MNAEDIALTVHAHPTLGEMTMEVAEKLLDYQSILCNFLLK